MMSQSKPTVMSEWVGGNCLGNYSKLQWVGDVAPVQGGASV